MKIFLSLLLLCPSLIFPKIFDINNFSNPKKYGWEDNKDRLKFRKILKVKSDLYQLYDLRKYSYPQTIGLSAILPGWGQFNTEHYVKGQILITSNIAILGTAYYFYDSALGYNQKYKNATQVQQMKQFYSDANYYLNYAQIITGIYALFWVYNIYDAIKSTDAYNTKLWNQIKKNKKFELTKNGVSYKF